MRSFYITVKLYNDLLVCFSPSNITITGL